MPRYVLHLTAALLLSLSSLAWPQTRAQQKTVSINGQTGQIMVYEIDGRSYVDLEALARLGGGTLGFQQNQIVLTFPATQAAPLSAASGAQTSAAQNSGMSQAFMSAAVQDLNVIQQWRQIIAYGLDRGVPGDGTRLVQNRDKAAEGLHQAQIAASNSSDQGALQLLTTQYNNVNQWYEKMVVARQNMATGNYAMTPNAFRQDPTYQAMEACHKFLSTMIPSGTFSDDGSCHTLSF